MVKFFQFLKILICLIYKYYYYMIIILLILIILDHSLKKLFIESKNLKAFTLFGNSFIYGTFPSFNMNQSIYLDYLQVFSIHGLNIKGKIPNNINLANKVTTKYTIDEFTQNTTNITITMYDNQLSSSIPSNLYNYTLITQNNFVKLFPVILLNNLFYFDNNDKINNKWLNNNETNDFIKTQNLYLNNLDIIISYFFVIIMFIMVMVLILVIIFKKKCLNFYVNNVMEKNSSKFFINLYQVNNKMLNWKLF